MIHKVVFTLADKFPEVDFDISYKENLKKYEIIVNDYDTYFSKKFNKWCKLLSKKFKKQKFYCVYKKF